jgi:acetolactate synthase-1/2/3 large subunit
MKKEVGVSRNYDGGELMVAAFDALDVDYIFSSPGSEWAPVWEALARRSAAGTATPTYLDLTHETVAVGMATGYSLATRRTQAVLLHAGPGLMQGSMAIHGALLAGVPMVVASSESTTFGEGDGPDPGGQWYRNLSHVGGPHTIAASFTKWANQVGSVSTLYAMTTRAGELAAATPAGPVYLNVPLEVLLDPAPEPVNPKPVAARGRTVAVHEDLDEVSEMVAMARRPLIITETAGREAGGFEALTRFAEELGIGVVEPPSAVCANISKDSPAYLGNDAEKLIDESDLILLVNCRAPFYPPSRRPAKAPIVVVDEVPQRPHIVYQVLNADAYLAGSVPATLDALREEVLLRRGSGAFVDRVAEVAARHATWVDRSNAMEEKAAGSEGIDPVSLAAALREMIDRDEAVVVDETITHSRAVQRHTGWRSPDSYFYVQGGLGQGMAVALGVKLAKPEKTVIYTVGDGAYLYNPVMQTLMAAKDNGLPVLVVIFNNKKYLSMKMNHLRFYPEGAAVSTNNHLGVDLRQQPELSEFAVPFGMHHEEVSNPSELDLALKRALEAVQSGTTAVLNVNVTK